jgi:hypothetical protein
MTFLRRKEAIPTAYVVPYWDQKLYEALTRSAESSGAHDILFSCSIAHRKQRLRVHESVSELEYVGNFRIWLAEAEYADAPVTVRFVQPRQLADDPVLEGLYSGTFTFSYVQEDGRPRPAISLLVDDTGSMKARLAALFVEHRLLTSRPLELFWWSDIRSMLGKSASTVWGEWQALDEEGQHRVGRTEFLVRGLEFTSSV